MLKMLIMINPATAARIAILTTEALAISIGGGPSFGADADAVGERQ